MEVGVIMRMTGLLDCCVMEHTRPGWLATSLHCTRAWELPLPPFVLKQWNISSQFHLQMNDVSGNDAVLYLGWGELGLMGWILLWIMPQVLDRSLDMLTCSPACFHCAMVAPTISLRERCKKAILYKDWFIITTIMDITAHSFMILVSHPIHYQIH